jgi:hypothetical protein
MAEPVVKRLGASSKDSDIVSDAKEHLQLCIDADGVERAKAEEELDFLNGNQWTTQEQAARAEPPARPCLTTNTLPAILHQVTNDNRQNRQSLHVHPAGMGADDDTAEVLEGLLRHIEYDSNADTAYDTAVSSAAAIGFGFFRLVSEFEYGTFDQVLKIKRVRNPFTVYIDPLSQEIDGSDARFAIITGRMGKKEFEARYPNADATVAAMDGGPGDTQNWFWKDECRVAEYYRIENTADTLCLYSDGSTGWASDNAELPFGVIKVKERPAMRRKVMWYKLSGTEVLAKTVVPCQWIPVFPVWGDEIDINGKVKRFGIIRNAKDPCRMYNFWLTSATEEIAMRPKSPYIGAVGQFEGMENDWAQANQRSFPYLEYNPVTVDGTLAPPPQRQPMADLPVGALQMAALARDNIKATTGIYDASLGARGNETSGRGIDARKKQGDIANFHYADNLSKSIRQMGRCAIEMIPHYYDTERVVRILGEDTKPRTVTLNQPNVANKKDKETGKIKAILNDVRVGKYEVVVASGPAYSTLRAEAAERMIGMGKAWPKMMDVAGDKVVAAMDWPGAQEIAERLARTIPAEIRDDPDEDAGEVVQTPKGPIPVAQAGDLIGRMDDAMRKMQTELEEMQSGIAKAKLDAESRENVAKINATSRENVEEIKGYVKMMVEQIPPAPDMVAIVNDVAARLAPPPAPEPAPVAAPEPVAPPPPAPPDPALMHMIASHQQIMAALTGEKEIVRGPDGKAMGVRAKRPAMEE